MKRLAWLLVLLVALAAATPAPPARAPAKARATRYSVLLMGKKAGFVAPGKYADVILVDGDPFRHVGDVRRVRTVVKNGVVYDSSELYRALGVAPQEGK